MDPLQEPAPEAPAVADPQQPPAETAAPDEPPVAPEAPLDHPPVSVNVEEQPEEQATQTPAEAPQAGPDQGYATDSRTHHHSHSTDHHHSAPEYVPQDDPRLTSSPSLSQQPQLHTASRPGSSFSNGPDRHGMAQQQAAEAAQRQPTQASKNSVVIKVGMVGDAQIGKTSLMVKYVEGSWDEDYIQTLGMVTRIKEMNITNMP